MFVKSRLQIFVHNLSTIKWWTVGYWI